MRKSLHRYAQRAFITVALAATGATQLWANPGDVVFSETFDSKEALDNWKIVDKNGGRTWEWLNGAASYMLDYQTGLPGDDWLISPEFFSRSRERLHARVHNERHDTSRELARAPRHRR